MKFGKNEEELFEVLNVLDETTQIDSVLTKGQRIMVEATRNGGKLTNWSVYEDVTAYKAGKIAKGTGYNSFEEAINTLNMTTKVNEELVVLCYASSETSKSWDGKIQTNWIVINPTIPFEMVDGNPDFPTLKLDLTQAEYKIAMESRLALYNEFSKDVYPIREIAFSSIGKLLDSAASFKNMAAIPLGSALLLADRIAEPDKKMKLIYRNSKGHVKPLIGIAGSRFAEMSETEYFKDAFDFIAENFGVYHIDRWEITNELSTVNVVLDFYTDVPIYLRIQTSDIPGTSASVTAFAKVGDASLLIQKNSAYHWDSFKEKGGSKGLFVRQSKDKNKTTIALKDDIQAFIESYNDLVDKEVTYGSADLVAKVKKITSLIGVKNTKKKVDEIAAATKIGEVYNSEFFVTNLINATYCVLPSKQANELTKEYGELISCVLTASSQKKVV